MIDSAVLLADLKRQLRVLEDDLRVRAEDSTTEWGPRLREEHRRAQSRERTGLAWIQWRDGEVSQAAVAWIIASVFIRFSEDNGLLEGAKRDGHIVAVPWFASPGDGLERAVENETAFYSAKPTRTTRDWLMDAFTALADLPAGRPLVDPDHSAIWQAPISAPASDALLAFFRRTTPDGALVHDFSDPDLDTRFLGDLYQDLSDYAKKTYALLQTPLFVEELILDLTLTPAIAEFGLTGLKVIDPACGSGHFLLGTFDRLVAKWAAAAPALDKGELVQRALNSVHGVDLNPFAIAIARFRLTVAALKSAGLSSLVGAPAFNFHLAIGDSLLGGTDYQLSLDLDDDEDFQYSLEDLEKHREILTPGRYHVVVANPPYINVRDPTLNRRYRNRFNYCNGSYSLSVPFMELLFGLAKGGSGGGGFVGQITSNSFMSRDFGKRLVEIFMTGQDPSVKVDLTHVLDTSDVKLAGHGTPTVILIGRRRRPVGATVRAALGIQGDGSNDRTSEFGPLWRSIVEQINHEFENSYVAISSADRDRFARHPWSLSGGGAASVKTAMESSATPLADAVELIGRTTHTGLDDAFFRPAAYAQRHRIREVAGVVVGEGVRDFEVVAEGTALFPYDEVGEPLEPGEAFMRDVWPLRAALKSRIDFGRTPEERKLRWYDHSMFFASRFRASATIAFAFVATHNHFAIDRGQRIFNRSSPVLKFHEPIQDELMFGVLATLSSSCAAFWLRETGYLKGGGGEEAWADRMEYTVARLLEFPLPATRPSNLAQQLVGATEARAHYSPSAWLSREGPDQLDEPRAEWNRLTKIIVSLQEEIDWQAYVAYGLADSTLAPDLSEPVAISPNERPFEIFLARNVAAGRAISTWFDRHGRAPVTQLPAHWHSPYRELIERRLGAIATSPALHLLEQPEYKRRWAGASWDDLLQPAVRDSIQNRLEIQDLWIDSGGRPRARSIAQLADELRRDTTLHKLLELHTGSPDYDFASELGRIIGPESVPPFATLRYRSSGIEKFRAWERTWVLQRADDRGERVDVPVPPKYAPADFLQTSYWTARGKLDVPKERFIAFPGSHFSEDSTAVYGWAGWDHGERGQAIARFANDIAGAGAADDQIIPLVGALIELEPWLKQWHDEIGPTGVSPAGAVGSVITALLGRLGLGRDTIADWRPPQTTRRGRSNA